MPPEITYHANRCWEKQTPQSISSNWSTGLTRFPSLLLSFVLHSFCFSYYKKRKHLFFQNNTVSFGWGLNLFIIPQSLGRISQVYSSIFAIFSCLLIIQTDNTPPTQSRQQKHFFAQNTPSFVVRLGSNHINNITITITCHCVWLFSCSDFSQLYSSIIAIVSFQICN